MAYQRPMVTVDQNMTTTPTSVEREQPAFVFGPQYELHRYSDPDEKPNSYLGHYEAGVAFAVPYPHVIKEDNVDTDYTKLFGDNVVVQVANLGTPQMIETNINQDDIAINGGYTMLSFEGKSYVGYDGNGNVVELGNDASGDKMLRGLVKGDSIILTYTIGEQVQHVPTKIVEAKYSSSSWELDSSSGESEGAYGTLVKIADPIPVSATGLSVILVDTLQGVEFTRKNLRAGTGFQWEQEWTEDSVEKKGIKVNALNALDPSYFGDEETYGTVIYADLYVSYRELLTGYADNFHSLTGAASVFNTLGAVDPDNPLAMGVYMAALNASTDDGDEAPPVYFMAVKTDDLEGYAGVLNQATLNDRAYVFAPTTNDDRVIELLKAHVTEMSTKTVKQWRIGAVSKNIPSEKAVLSSANVYGLPYYAAPVETTIGGQAVYKHLRIVASSTSLDPNTDVKLMDYGLSAGDRILYYSKAPNGWGETVPVELRVKNIVNNFTIELDEPLASTDIPSGASTIAKIEVFHKYTSSQMADVVASESRNLASRRMLNVFPNYFERDGQTVGGEFAACAVAGLISATEPQQPITNMSVNGIDEIPITYRDFNKTELDTIAAGGTFIVAQDLPGDKVYVRHQITTAYPDGNLNTAELSITKNVDSISYAFADVFRPYYGKYNIVPELIAILENLAGNLISQLGGSTSVYGPQLITDQTVIRYVRQNQLMKDHVDIAISLSVPYPCNNIDIVLTV